MRKSLFVFLLLPFALSSQQTFQTLPDSDAIWTLENMNSTAVSVSFTVPTANADTLIGSYIYKKVLVASLANIFGNGYLGCYRSLTNGLTYYIPKDSVQEFLLMDLNVQQGDTVFNVYYHDQNIILPVIGDFTVAYTMQLSFGSIFLKEIVLNDFNGNFSLTWIEKIGSMNGLNNQIGDGLNPWQIFCMSSKDTSWFSNLNPVMFPNQTCQLDLSTQNIYSNNTFISASPNPFTSEISILNYQQGSEIFLYDALGRLIFTSLIGPNGNVLFPSTIMAGIYVLEIKDEKGNRISMQKMVKE